MKYSIKYKKDYLKEFLDKSFKIIAAPKALLYGSPNDSTKMYLLKGDAVEILSEKEKWYKISYYGSKKIDGWILKSDVGKDLIDPAIELHK